MPTNIIMHYTHKKQKSSIMGIDWIDALILIIT